jgi:Holliday junction resolvase RusA-like endonuclease
MVAHTLLDPPTAAAPLDVVLDIPTPPSVNVIRKVNPAGVGVHERWKVAADRALLASGQYRAAKRIGIPERFELTIILNEAKCRLDLDNCCKSALDYLRRIELIKNDDHRFLRKLTVIWGEAPAGARLILRGAEP